MAVSNALVFPMHWSLRHASLVLKSQLLDPILAVFCSSLETTEVFDIAVN